MDLAEYLNGLPPDRRSEALRACCGSARWVEGMLARVPFARAADVFDAAEEIWWGLAPSDWLEAFAAHPKIGARRPEGRFSSAEQAGVRGASAGVLDALARRNLEYEDRFGFIFLVCASGRSADEMLAELEARLDNPPERELRVAAAEQAKITRLRLARLADEA